MRWSEREVRLLYVGLILTTAGLSITCRHGFWQRLSGCWPCVVASRRGAAQWQNPKCREDNSSHDLALFHDINQRCLLLLFWLTHPWRQHVHTVFKLSFYAEIKFPSKATHRHWRGKNTHILYLALYESAGRLTVNFTALFHSGFTATTVSPFEHLLCILTLVQKKLFILVPVELY